MRALVLFIGSLSFSLSLTAQNLQVFLQTSVPAPQPVGTAVALNFSARDTNAHPGILNYKVEIEAPAAQQFLTLHDYTVAPAFTWSQNLHEGTYQIRITARDSNYLGQTGQIVVPFVITSRATNGQPVVSATSHPLVALFSAPACTTPQTMRVTYQATGHSSPPYDTNFVGCDGVRSMNFLVAGLAPVTNYTFTYQLRSPAGVLQNGQPVSWTSGPIAKGVVLAPVTFPVPFGPLSSQPERISIISSDTSSTPEAVDPEGRVIWYYQGSAVDTKPGVAVVQITRLINGGTLLDVAGTQDDFTGTGVFGNQYDHQVIQELDFAGGVIRETCVDRVNEQLILRGADPISTFNHDARRLPNGDTMVVALVQKVFPAGTQGSPVPIDILGTTLVELDQNFQVIWYWESFNHTSPGELDINRPATLHEQCTAKTLGQNGCPPVLLTDPANDWLHTNTVQLQADGSLVISMRNQDWLGKIDFNNGAGTGKILWMLGEGGNFALVNSTNAPYPWFSHQHDAEIIDSKETLIMFDNGNPRVIRNGGNSRGYVMNVDENTLTATTVNLFDMGYFAGAQGSAQLLSNGDYMFSAGQIYKPTQFQFGAEFNASGAQTFSEETAISSAYRVWRVPNFDVLPVN